LLKVEVKITKINFLDKIWLKFAELIGDALTLMDYMVSNNIYLKVQVR
jgi:hypothetical protein